MLTRDRLNFKDIMVAMGQLQQLGLGIDASGTVSRVGSGVHTFCPGDRVMTWRPGAFSNLLRSPVDMVQKNPEGMNFATAASLPVVYSTAYYALHYAARLLPGETVLIHGAAGGTSLCVKRCFHLLSQSRRRPSSHYPGPAYWR